MQVLIPLHSNAQVGAQLRFVAEHDWPPETEFAVMGVVKPIALMDFGLGCPHHLIERVYRANQAGTRQIVKHSVDMLRQKLPGHAVRPIISEGGFIDEVLEECSALKPDLLVLGKEEAPNGRIAREQAAIASSAPCSIVFVDTPAERYHRTLSQA